MLPALDAGLLSVHDEQRNSALGSGYGGLLRRITIAGVAAACGSDPVSGADLLAAASFGLSPCRQVAEPRGDSWWGVAFQ